MLKLVLPSRLLRPVIGAVILVPVLLFVYTQRTPTITYILPEVLDDYVSPSAQCSWSGKGKSKAAADEIPAHLKGLVNLDHGSTWEGPLPDYVPVVALEQYAQAHIDELQIPYNAQHDFETYGLKLGNISLSAYKAELLETYYRYLHVPDKPTPAFLPPVLSRLSFRPPLAPLPPRPKQVMTTDKTINHLPSEFARWNEIMPDWEIKYFNDKALKAWVKGMFGGTRGEKIWNNLPRVVLKTDIFRYMAMLCEGGIYTDSDTAPIIHADVWGQPYESATSPLLTHMTRLLSLSTSPGLPPSHPLSSFAPLNIDGDDAEGKGAYVYEGPLVDDGAESGLPGLVVSVESDAIEFGWDNWREVGLSRAVQIVQWTIMARPGHPVFLDAIGRTMRKSEEMAAVPKGDVPDTALEWTGPGVFTDCVYRYMLARYGFRPEQLVHQKVPIRIGDVLILPAGSYSSVSPFTNETQRDWAASYHGFFGRWRDADPGVQEFERLKKIKEAEEKAAKAEAEARDG